jgi:LacI family gluconate utilization system Gnt-I transcriptional repressor
MNSSTKMPNLKDVAQLSGTSPITVSRSFRNPKAVAPQTLARIHAAVAALGYVPNLAASSLASRRSGLLGVLVPTIGDSIFSETVRGVAHAVKAADLELIIGEFDYSDRLRYKLVRALVGRRADGLVFVGSIHDAPTRNLLKQPNMPVVETWELDETPVDMAVGFSNFEAGVTVARHFLERGRKRCAFVGEVAGRAAARLAGFEAALSQAKARRPVVHDSPPGLAIKAGREGVQRLLERAPDIDAIFFASDAIAVGGLLECRRLDIAVPGRIAMAGVGDLEIGRELEPGLTTIKTNAYDMGCRAGEFILARLEGPAEPQARGETVDVGFSLIVRGTS